MAAAAMVANSSPDPCFWPKVRKPSRAKTLTSPTSGLPRATCKRISSCAMRPTSVSEPGAVFMVAESAAPGRYESIKSYLAGADILSDGICVDLPHSIPRYMVYRNLKLARAEALDITGEWDDGNHVGLVGGTQSGHIEH
ncbi:hypothetical protein PG994_001902 [Apiospora phragmitis]|uniref:Uncharacterized protein n=1 Tax=Apiospora phragmitis TaxID=2905665 RepID=A0ABR1WUT1_9PEZI